MFMLQHIVLFVTHLQVQSLRLQFVPWIWPSQAFWLKQFSQFASFDKREATKVFFPVLASFDKREAKALWQKEPWEKLGRIRKESQQAQVL